MDALTRQVVSNYLDTQKTETGRSDEYYSYMMDTFRPIEKSLAGEASSFDTEAKRAELAGQVGADVEQAAGASDAAARRDAARFGINPSDAAFSEGLAGSSLNKTIMKVGAMNNARTAARAEGRALKFDVTNLGRGLPQAAASSTALGMNAASGAMGAGTTSSSNARADAGMANTAFGTAANVRLGLGSLGIAQQQQDRLQQGQDFNQMMNIIGGGAALFSLSSRKAKDRIGSVSEGDMVKAIKTMPVDRWRYKPDAKKRLGRVIEGDSRIIEPDADEHIGPYAEDFKKRFGVGDGKKISIIDALGVTFAIAKGLAKQVDELKGATT
jgi:hypothetical protein